MEKSMLWLTKQFGKKTLQEVEVILPEKEYFPDPFSKSQSGVAKVVERVCGYMRVNPKKIRAEIYSETARHPPEAAALPGGRPAESKVSAGRYIGSDETGGKAIIAIEKRKLDDPIALVATVAHELGHVRLLGERRLTGEEPDHEPLTDLTAIFFGLGIFIANAAFEFGQWQHSLSYGWSASRHGYLNEPMYGYALACFAWLRGEYEPDWNRYLDPNPRKYFKNGLRHLDETRETTLPMHHAWPQD